MFTTRFLVPDAVRFFVVMPTGSILVILPLSVFATCKPSLVSTLSLCPLAAVYAGVPLLVAINISDLKLISPLEAISVLPTFKFPLLSTLKFVPKAHEPSGFKVVLPNCAFPLENKIKADENGPLPVFFWHDSTNVPDGLLARGG